jgi:hypothetical protein
MAKLEILSTPTGEKGKIVKEGSTFDLFKGDTIQFNGQTAKVSYFKRGLPNLLIYEIDGKGGVLTPEELDMVEKVVGGRKSRRKSRKTRKSRKSRKYRR